MDRSVPVVQDAYVFQHHGLGKLAYTNGRGNLLRCALILAQALNLILR